MLPSARITNSFTVFGQTRCACEFLASAVWPCSTRCLNSRGIDDMSAGQLGMHIIIIIIFYFHLKNQTRYSAITYKVIEMVGCQKSKCCSSSWPPITTFTCIVNIQTFPYSLAYPPYAAQIDCCTWLGLCVIWDSALCARHCHAQAIGFPLAQGRSVVPSGCLLSSLIRLTGSWLFAWSLSVWCHSNDHDASSALLRQDISK